MGHAGKVDAVCGELNGSQFDMGFFEEAVGAQGYLELVRYFLGCRRGDNGGGQGNDIGIDVRASLEDIIRWP